MGISRRTARCGAAVGAALLAAWAASGPARRACGAAGWRGHPERPRIGDHLAPPDGGGPPAGADGPRLVVPPCAGQRYEAEVPDTLDLAERAALAINGLTRVVDPERDYELYFVAEFAEDPPKLYHEWCGSFNTTKFLEALPLLRIMSGSDANLDVDAKIMEGYLRDAGEDGLYYRPVAGRPWAFYIEQGTEEVAFTRDRYGFTFGEGRLIMALCMWYQRDRDPRWQPLIERKIRRLLELGYRDGDAISFSRFFTPGQVTREAPPRGIDSWAPFGAVTYYQLTGCEPALALAGAQVRHLRRWIGDDGRFLLGHFHLSAAALTEMLEYAISVNDPALIELVRKGYEYGKSVGEPRIGFFPEDAYPDFPTCESCAVADMIYLAIRLTRIGAADCWDDADRWIRNQFAENQLTRADAIQPRRIRAQQTDEARARIAGQIRMTARMPGIATTQDVLERCVGCWSGWGTANDWVSRNRAGIMQCCTGNAARTLYYAWDAIVTPDADGTVRVNLPLNRAAPWLDVDSYLPYEGRIAIRNKTATTIAVRVPGWVDPAGVQCRVNGGDRATVWSGRYVQLAGLRPGDVVTIDFPMTVQTVSTVAGNVPYTLTLKGHTVVDIDPDGTMCPLYQRDHYKADRAPLRRTTRFVPSETIDRSPRVPMRPQGAGRRPAAAEHRASGRQGPGKRKGRAGRSGGSGRPAGPRPRPGRPARAVLRPPAGRLP